MYDVITIGTSPKIFFNTAHYARQGKNVLVVDADSSMGGNWQITNFAGVENVELGGFVIQGSAKTYNAIEKQSGIHLFEYQFPPVQVYAGKHYPLGSLLLRIKLMLARSRKPMNLLRALRLLFRHIKKVRSRDYALRYPRHGVAAILKRFDELIEELQFEVRLDTKINDIYVDFSTATVHLTDTSGRHYESKKLIVGSGLDIPAIRTSRFQLPVNTTRVPNIFTFVLVAFESSLPIEYSYADMLLQDTNQLLESDLEHVDFKRLPIHQAEGKYHLLWRTTHVTPYAERKISDPTRVLCIDTDGWVPREGSEDLMTRRLLQYLQQEKLLPAQINLKEFSWQVKTAYLNPGLEKTVGHYFNGLIETTNTHVIALNPQQVSSINQAR